MVQFLWRKNMDKKNLLIEIGYKLKKVREALRLKNSELADDIGFNRSSFCRYESGKTPPGIKTLYGLGEKFNISLDWLICNKGEMFYREIAATELEKESMEPPAPPSSPTLDSLPGDIRELLEHMERIPLLRYEILTYFLKFKDKNKELVLNAFTNERQEAKERA
jgi:transcriptional regulator with XRE-family HTH domain